ncbi:MAG: tRNA (N(6)-L-threonylcarbamoyladenosine(37)-C(2))-methylthiotransferase MtaB [Candidatus Rokubacteria bacterium 13_1_20CM_2_70_7]|nr:MAG: tRNA (N(6)-L-threonylcarbamoyladenosine(37)-C(2))-methylthiotransferase MtaB [Candidatus Rokubacteria bacterium 13_1_20CM_2_70_7]
MTGRTVSFATLGCRLNQVDTQEIQAALEARGFRTVPLDAPADVVLVNTCTVTSRADFSDRQMIHRAVRGRRGARIVVTGCWAQTDPDAVARVRGVDLVVGNADKPRLPELLEELLARPEDLDPTPRRCVSDIGTERVLAAAPLARINGRSRIFVKIQDGCQHRCAFCIVPFARGPSRSREPKAVLDQIRLLVEGGYPEVVLTGVDLGHYGHDLYPRSSLAALLREMIEIPGLRWVRLSSVLPAYFTPELIELITGSPLIAPHLHIPLQSGSDRVLRRMRRPYTVGMYRRLVERLASAIPALGLGADVIVGFPGETDADFAETRALVEALPFSYLHVFAYSDRRGTEAARLGGHVGARLVTARSRELRGLGQAKSLAFRRGLVGTTRELLVLETRDRQSGHLVGLTGNYVEVVFDGPAGLMRQLVTVRLIGVDGTRTLGELEAPSDL